MFVAGLPEFHALIMGFAVFCCGFAFAKLVSCGSRGSTQTVAAPLAMNVVSRSISSHFCNKCSKLYTCKLLFGFCFQCARLAMVVLAPDVVCYDQVSRSLDSEKTWNQVEQEIVIMNAVRGT